MRKKFQVDSDLANVQRASRQALAFIKPLPVGEAALFDIRLCLEEALINAMKYGNALQKSLPVELDIEGNPEEVRITVKDQGPGFDVSRLKNCTDERNLFRSHGRGVYLIHQLMDEVRYNEKGNSLLMVKKIRNVNQSA